MFLICYRLFDLNIYSSYPYSELDCAFRSRIQFGTQVLYNHRHNSLSKQCRVHLNASTFFRRMPPLKEKASLANPLPMSHLTDVQIASILRFREAGWSTEAIGQNLHHSRHFVSRSLCNSEFEFVERRHNTAQGRLHGLAGHRSRNDCGERESKKNNSLVFFF